VCLPRTQIPDEPYFDTWILAQAAKRLGKTDDAERYTRLAEEIKHAFACFAFGLAAGEPMADVATRLGAEPVWANNAPTLLILVGGGTTNVLWCLVLNRRNRTAHNYFDTQGSPLLNNYLVCTLAGLTAYMEFMFLGMGETQMGEYGFSSWSIHMACVIVFSNMWGMILHEWKGTSLRTKGLVLAGIATLIASTMVMGYGNYLKTLETPLPVKADSSSNLPN